MPYAAVVSPHLGGHTDFCADPICVGIEMLGLIFSEK